MKQATFKERQIEEFTVTRETDKVWNTFSHSIILALGDPQDAELLNEIYVTQRVREYDNKFLDSLVFGVPPAFMDDALAAERSGRDIDISKFSAVSPEPNTPVFILGYVGTGKTTWLRHAFQSNIGTNANNLITIMVNGLKVSSSEASFKSSLLDEMRKSLYASAGFANDVIPRDSLRDLFCDVFDQMGEVGDDKERNDEAAWEVIRSLLAGVKERSESAMVDVCTRILRHHKKHKCRTWLIIDNLDQIFLYVNSKLYLALTELTKTLEVGTIVALRYVTWDLVTGCDAIVTSRNRHLCLSLPDIGLVVEKRMKLLKRFCVGIMGKFEWTGNMLGPEQLMEDILGMHGHMARKGFLQNDLWNLANRNIRVYLDVLTRVYQSYYFFHDPFNNRRFAANEHTIAKRVIYAMCLGNRDGHNPGEVLPAGIINLFENENRTGLGNQLIRIRILQVFSRLNAVKSMSWFADTLLNMLHYEKTDIGRAIHVLQHNGLLTIRRAKQPGLDSGRVLQDAELNEENWSSEDFEGAITKRGRYILDQMVSRLEYIEIMKHSTYVYPKELSLIKGQDKLKSFKERRSAVVAFLDYMISEENQEDSYVNNKLVFNQFARKVFVEIKTDVIRQLNELETYNVYGGGSPFDV